MTFVSTIIPTYNRSYIVHEAIKSILNQSYPRVEIIVVDDGSTDETLTKLREFGDKIRVIPQPNAGPAAARNRGICESRGEILMFLDSDDIWLPTYIERQVSVLERAGKQVACSLSNGWLEFANKRKITAFDYTRLQPEYEEGLWMNPDEIFATRFLQFNQMAAIRREALDKIGGFDSELKYLEDWDLALRLSLNRPWCFIREPLVRWRQNTDSLSRVSKNDEVTLRRTVVEIRLKAMQRLSAENGSLALNEHMRRGLGHNRRELFAANMSERGKLGSFAANVLRRTENVRELIWAALDTPPRMQVARIPA